MKYILLAIVAAMFLSSCSKYSSYHPVGERDDAASFQQFVGDWTYYSHNEPSKDKTTDQYDPHIFRVIPFNRKEFIVEVIPDGDNQISAQEHLSDVHLLRGWLSEIDNKYFVNLCALSNEAEESEYFIHYIEVSGDTIIARAISDDVFKKSGTKINSIADHREFIKAALQKPEYWDHEYRYVRKKGVN
ncbi:MAG: hypothetical protein AAFN93_17810 [Bacteroidota bacterium]